jgi:RNA polymerase sigma-70 factor, ECF subfamily
VRTFGGDEVNKHLGVPSAPNDQSMDALSERSDAQLVTSIARCSEDALAEVYRRHGGAVYGLARRVLNSTAEAEDVTQEIFLRLWNEPDRFDPSRGALRSFLLAQAHRRAVDSVRSLNARHRREAKDAHRSGTASYDLEHEVWDLAIEERVIKALDELPREERRAIELAYFKGYTYVEVARFLEQPEGTIKGRIRNGMQRMRVALIEAGIQGVDA